MRIKDYVAAHGVDACSTEDFYFVGSKVSTDPSRLVLVGGQAIETWGQYFKVPAPSGNAQPLTEDIDWYGDRKAALWLCTLLGRANTEIKIADPADPSPNSAVAFHQRPDGRVVLLDFLKTLVGIEPNDIQQRAVPIEVGGVKLYVLHPLLCLESRLANLAKLPEKRNGNGKMQAEWAVGIVSAFIREIVISRAPQKQIIKACSEVAEAAEYRSGPFCYDEFQIDPLDAIPADLLAMIGGLFASEDWPRRVARIKAKREARLARQIALQQVVSYKFTLITSAITPASGPTRSPSGRLDDIDSAV